MKKVNIMKKALFLLVILTFSVAQLLNAQTSPQFEFTKLVHEFGEVPQGKPVSIDFEFKNAGSAPLIITNVQPTCGCSVADFPKTAIKPGATGNIKGTFNAEVAGVFNKSFTVYSNTGKQIILKISGKVVPQKNN